MSRFSDLIVIDPQGTGESTHFGPSEGAEGALVLVGTDALHWVGATIAGGPTSLVAWPNPAGPLYCYGDGEFNAMSVVIVSAGGPGPDGADLQPRWSEPDEGLARRFDHPTIRIDADLSDAVERLCGSPDRAADLLHLSGGPLTIWAGAESWIAAELAGQVPLALTTETGPERVVSATAWTRRTGSFVMADRPAGEGGTTVLTGVAASERASALLEARGGFDLLGAAAPGHGTDPLADFGLLLDGLGGGSFQDDAAPDRPVIVLRGAAAERIRAEAAGETASSPIGPPPAEDSSRFEAHQWASYQRRAHTAATTPIDIGGPTLLAEAAAIGFVGTHRAVDTRLLTAIASARGWREIDSELPGILDPVVAHARGQIRGDNTPVPADALAALRARSAESGFWDCLLSSTLPVTGDQIVFPYPPVAVDLLRATVAANGDAARLRHLIGPVKVAVMSAFGGSDD